MKKFYFNNFAIALWWWSARGLAHIGLFKYLEEKEVKATEIAGTSMWAILAAAYAIWKSSDEIKDICKDINYLKLIDFDLKSGLLKWNAIFKFLDKIFWDTLIESTEIKLKIVATDIDTGEKKIFKKRKIKDAVRASISIPWIFMPYTIGEERFVDWGIVNNLPIDVLIKKNIIAVSVLKDVKEPLKLTKKVFWFDITKNLFSNSYLIIQKTMEIFLAENEKKSLSSKNKNIICIKPNLQKYWYHHFNLYPEIIKEGYEESKNILDKI